MSEQGTAIRAEDYKTVPLLGNWQGWICRYDYLYSPSGDKYLPADLLETFYGRQIYRHEVGYEHTIKTLKSHLIAQIEEYEGKIREIDKYHQFIIQAKTVFGA